MAKPHLRSGEVERALRAAPAHALPEALAGAVTARFPQVTGARLYLVDYRLASLLPAESPSEHEPIAVPGTPAGRAFASLRPVPDPAGSRARRVFVPVAARGDRMGVLALDVDAPCSREDFAELADIGEIAGGALKVAWALTDRYERVRRDRRLTLAAELQWQLLPGQTCAGERFDLAGHLEPAYSVAGDNFDWTAERDHLTLSVTNGAGEGIRAALLTSLTVGALRNARRGGADLAEQASLAADIVHARYGGEWFTETLLMRVDLASGEATVVDAGSPRVLRMRGTRVARVELEQQMPLGMFADTEYRAQRLRLESGDRLVIVSDGVYSAPHPGGGDFGTHRLEQAVRSTRLQDAAGVPLAIIGELMGAHEGAELADDAVVVCVDWH